MTGSVIANIADYADALLTTRKARNILVLLLLVMLFFQLALFFTVRYKIQIAPGGPAESVAPTTSVVHQTSPALIDFLKYLTGLVDFAGVIVPFVLAVDLWLIVSIMLMGRLLGVSRLVSAFLWCVVLIALLFPWQAFLNNQTFTSTEFKVPGVLYTWTELAVRGRIHPAGIRPSILYWARFVGWPIVAILIVLMIQHLSGLGLRLAMGKNPSTPPSPAVES
ncbi:MAG TPA: hypothetical protein VHX86_09445 [Tepidisphaeraceae bacterium]|jgi:hypothetical protein|nr:hypothetical protein [Tepidisphaeraceae bacterium]